MKSIKRLLTAAFTAVLCLSVFALTLCVFPAEKAYAEDKPYTFKVTVNAGKEGKFSGDATIRTYTGISNEGSLTITADDLGLTVNDDYYVRGLKFSGHDNDETNDDSDSTNVKHYTLPLTLDNITEDISLSVAYGLKGSMKKYVVNYVDRDGNTLLDSEEYYGMVGDYPVVSYQVVDGYLPDAYKKGKTLVDDESENVFTFVYSQNANGGTETQTITVNDNTGNAGTPAGNAGPAAGGQPANFVNLDDGQTPTTDPGAAGANNGDGNGNNGGGQTDIPDDNTPTGIQSGKALPYILGGGLLAALIALIAFLRTRGKDGDKEDADQLEDMYLNDKDAMDKLSQADTEEFKTSDPDELKKAFKKLGKK